MFKWKNFIKLSDRHPHAYLNAMYMGEIAICKVLDDPKNKISELKAKTIPYPENLKNAILG